MARAARKAQSDDIEFVKQVPVHPRDRLTRATKKAQSDDVEFVKQVPVHPRDRLARATKEDVEFLKQITLHPRNRLRRKTKILKHPKDRMKEKELKVARDNVSALIQGKFVLDPERFLNKTVFFDTSKVDEEK